MIEGYEIQMYCEKHKLEYWLDSADPIEKRGCPKCLEEKHEAIIEPSSLLTFKNRKELIKTLKSLPKDMVCLVGYVDKNDIIRALKKEDFVSQVR